MLRAIWLSAAVVLLAGCGGKKPVADIQQLTQEFVYTSLRFSPVTATQAGYHQHQGVVLDELLDDFSPAAIDTQRKFYSGFRKRLDAIQPEQLTAEDRADYDILRGQCELTLLELDTIQNYRHNPTLYVESIGNALFSPSSLDYAPKPQRYRHIIARLGRLRVLLESAKQNLADAPEIWNKVAQEENEGNIGLLDKTLREGAPAELRADYDRAVVPALEALREFNRWLKDDLSKRTSDWRLGSQKYAAKFRYALGTDRPASEVLAQAEADIKTVRKQMWDLALPLHKKMYPTHRDPVDLNLIVGEVLSRVADRHATPASYFADARRDLDETRRYVKEKNLLPLPARDNLQVIETPEFMRGIYAVGGFNPAPALEPKLGAYYWITPIPPDWPQARIESKLREYNFYSLKLLTIHEAMPGHYVQFEYANDVQPEARRVLRGIYGNGPYIEGWAVYATEMMLDEGYLNGSPELRLTFLKQVLRLLANAVLDVRLHTAGMTDEQAMELMVKKCFQENEEASAKLQRAKLSSCQLPTYYAGWRDWQQMRRDYQAKLGAGFKLGEFHEKALKSGSVPLSAARRLLGL
ncbi:MAG: DUF885 domain-containing protein [Acidobacteriales bacterium]|nr:DUF885 domain-containing protein [Terriglobales bacterium]